MNGTKRGWAAAAAVTLGVSLAAVLGSSLIGSNLAPTAAARQAASRQVLEGSIQIDGSSTVFPITEAVAEEFQKQNPKVRVTVGISGTGGGFKRFVVGETDINDASRTIKDSEKQAASANGIEYLEFPIAYDGISVVVNPRNTWIDSLTLDDLKRLWEPGSSVKTWADLRPGWPAREIHLYGPGTDSGTFDYFTEEVVGEAKASRPDYTASEDDNVLVYGVGGDRDALGYFGYAYYVENRDRLKVVPINGGKGPVAPNDATINDGTYPLSRPIFIYVSRKSLERPEMQEFVRFYLTEGPALAAEVGYIPLPQEMYEQSLRLLEDTIGR